MTFFILER